MGTKGLEKSGAQTASILLSSAGGCVSALFVWFGIALSSDLSLWTALFGYLAIAYGAINGLLLLIAWIRPGPRVQKASKTLAFVLLAATVGGSFDLGRLSGLEVAGIPAVAAMLFVNWYVVKRLVAGRTRV